jgi:drug/metabolite transporter (DMT)-like permease
MARPFPWPLLLGTGLTLGLGAPLAKLAAAQGVGALAFTFWPTAAAGLALLLLGAWRRGGPAEPRRWLRFSAIAGLFGHALPMSALFWLAADAGAAFASLSLALPPVATLCLGLLAGYERWSRWRLLAVGLGLSGALLMLLARGGSFEPTPLRVALALAIPLSIGAANIYRSRAMPPGLGGEWLSAGTLLASALLLSGFGLGFGELAVPARLPAWAWLALQALVLVIGYLFYFALQRRADPLSFSFIGYVMMLAGVALGSLLFGEQLPLTLLPALALVLAALGLLRVAARHGASA